MKFAMTIRTDQNALVYLSPHHVPTSGVTFRGNSKVLILAVQVVKLKSLRAFGIATKFTCTTFDGYRISAYLLSPLSNSSD
jgi:hypothetical protein